MAASDHLGAQFQEQGPSPLDYETLVHPLRAALVHPEAGEPEPGDTYFAERRKQITRSKTTGRPLKRPRTEITPGAAPGTVAFADYSGYRTPGWSTHDTDTGETTEHPPSRGLYVHYMRTRRDVRGQGHAGHLLDEMVRANPDVSHVDFGKVMNETMESVYQGFAKRHPHITTHRKINF